MSVLNNLLFFLPFFINFMLGGWLSFFNRKLWPPRNFGILFMNVVQNIFVPFDKVMEPSPTCLKSVIFAQFLCFYSDVHPCSSLAFQRFLNHPILQILFFFGTQNWYATENSFFVLF